MAVTKKLRFEVFKRDSFKCQYCGRCAPDVVLQADHIHPVAAGGTDDLLNLITSCFDCNQGKKDRLLTDDTVIAKQKTQLDQLQERREQIEMMMEWQRSLNDMTGYEVDRIAERWDGLTDQWHLNQTGKAKIRKWIAKFSFEEVLSATEISITHYCKYKDDKVTEESWGVAFNKVPGVCVTKRREKENPDIREINYIRVVLRNKSKYVDEQYFRMIIGEAQESGYSIEWLKRMALNASNFRRFYNDVRNVLDGR